MNLLLFDHPEIRASLLPLTYTRPVADLRLGILTIAEKWAYEFDEDPTYLTQEYLSEKYPAEYAEDNLYINGAFCPNQAVLEEIRGLASDQGFQVGGRTIAFRTSKQLSLDQLASLADKCQPLKSGGRLIGHTWELFLSNGEQIEHDFKRLTKGRSSQKLDDPHTIVYNPSNLFIEEGVSIKAAIINAEGGPVYLGKHTEIQEGTIIQGPFALGEHSQLRLGGKMRPNTTIGPYCKVGGEVGNAIFQSNSNKAHEGFLGNSVVGAWCNLGADTNNSNLKNNYSNVRVWNYHQNDFVDTGLQFCGLVMGDHSKCSINTMLNTGTVVGVCANIHGTGFPSKFVPSFIWGGTEQSSEYRFDKACETVARVMDRRDAILNHQETHILKTVYENSVSYRKTLI